MKGFSVLSQMEVNGKPQRPEKVSWKRATEKVKPIHSMSSLS